MQMQMRHDDPLYYYTGDIPENVHYVIGRYKQVAQAFGPVPTYYHPPVLLERVGNLWQIVNAEDKYTKPPDIWIPIPNGVRIAPQCTTLDISLLQQRTHMFERELDTWQKLHQNIKSERDLLNDLIYIQKERIYELGNRSAAGPWEPYSDALYDEIQDADGSVWAAWRFDSTAKREWGYAYTRRSGPPMDNKTTVWETSSGKNLHPRLSPWMRRNPDYIACIIPPKEAATDAD